MNFAGTSGNGGSKYFTNNIHGEKYYSYYSTVKDGGVAHSVLEESMVHKKQTLKSKISMIKVSLILLENEDRGESGRRKLAVY